jgi:hypothetical protein
MIKFDIDRALAGDKVITRDGGEVNQFFVIHTDNGPTLTGYIVDSNTIETWDIYGGCYGVLNECHDDLFMSPNKLTGFVNVYADSGVSNKYPTKEAADISGSVSPRMSCIVSPRIACIDLSSHNVGEGL